jgi:tetratricopeptide (TPR) repeat protein
MRRLSILLSLLLWLPVEMAQAQTARQPASYRDRELTDALALAKAGRYPEAAQRLFQLSYSPQYANRRMQIKYILGMTLMQMKLYQVSAFQFIGVIKEGHNPYVKQSLEKLSLAADALGDDTLLNYAISRVNVDEFPRVHRDMLYYRIGEFQMRNKQFDEAARAFSHVVRGNALFNLAKYNEGLAYAEANQPDRALTAFEELLQSRANKSVVDKTRVDAMMGKARVLYQKKSWDEAIAAYREVPRDSEFWHDTVFESSWAMLRSGRFRSAMSNFQSLHSAFYEDTYVPESLLLRAIVYLYICKYDEMDKTLNLFNLIYKPVFKRVNQLADGNASADHYFNMMNNVLKAEKTEDFNKASLPIPYLIATKISSEGDFQKGMFYVRRLLDEKRRVQNTPGGWQNSMLGQYSKKVLNTRLVKAKQKVGKIVYTHLVGLRDELLDFIEQEGFIRYEMINGRKETLKKKIAGKSVEDDQIDQNNQRNFYIQNGYEYWPFRGEYWLDELGNYHYVGTQSCN